MINSKQKGKVGELEWAKFCKGHGYDDVHRSKQYCGDNPDASDCVGLPGIYQEVKRVEHLNIDKAMEKAKEDCGNDQLPIVAHRKNRGKWMITMDADDWFSIYKDSTFSL